MLISQGKESMLASDILHCLNGQYQKKQLPETVQMKINFLIQYLNGTLGACALVLHTSSRNGLDSKLSQWCEHLLEETDINTSISVVRICNNNFISRE